MERIMLQRHPVMRWIEFKPAHGFNSEYRPDEIIHGFGIIKTFHWKWVICYSPHRMSAMSPPAKWDAMRPRAKSKPVTFCIYFTIHSNVIPGLLSENPRTMNNLNNFQLYVV